MTSPTSHAAAPDVDIPPPFALSGARLSARRVADHSVGILLREGKREIRRVAAGLACK